MRYFIVMYKYEAFSAQGNGISYCCRPSYINMKEFTENVLKEDSSIRNLVITNVIELSEEDFKTFISE